jgi:hypothetical protein
LSERLTLGTKCPNQPHSVYRFREFISDQNGNHPQNDRSDPASCEERGSRSDNSAPSPPTTNAITSLEDTGDDAVLSCDGVSVMPTKRAYPDSDDECVAKRWAGDEEVAASTEVTMLPDVEQPASTTKSTPVPADPYESTNAGQSLDTAADGNLSFANAGKPMSQLYSDICDHPGPCATENCACFKNEAPCRPACSCGPDCRRQFQRCRCNGACKRCSCRRLGWACIPNECSCSNCSNVYATVPPKLAVCRSSIFRGGKGLFALQTINKETYIGDYTGNRVAISAATGSSSNPRVTLFDISAGEDTLIFCQKTELTCV